MQAFADSAWQLLTNPNIAYLFLVLGLWTTVLAVAVPGTGLPEGAAVLCLALAAVGLLQLPVSIVGLGFIALAMGLFIAEVRFPAHGALLVSGALVMGVGGLLLFRTEDRSAAHLSWFTIVAAPLLTTGLFGLLIRQGLRAQKLPALQDLRYLLGAVGVARTDVAGQGTIYVAGEEWSATADAKIPAGANVVVVSRAGLVLKVAPAARDGGSSRSSAGTA